MSVEVAELQAIAIFQDIVFTDFPDAESLEVEVNRFASSIPNPEAIISRNLSLAIGCRYRSKEVLEEVCKRVNVVPESPYYAYEFTSNEILSAIIADKPDDLTSFFDKENPEGKNIKVKILGREAEIDYLTFAALTGSSRVYNMLLHRNLKPELITLVGAIISGHSGLITQIFNLFPTPPIPALLRIALLAFQKDVFTWLLEQFVLPSDELQNLLLFIAKTQPLPDDAFAPTTNIEKIDFTFNHVFESDNIQAIIACVQRGYVPGPNLSSTVGPTAHYVKKWVIALLKDKIKDGNDHRSEVVLGNVHRLSNLNVGPYFEFYCDDMRILRYDVKPSDEPQMGNNYDLVPREALELFKKAADAGDKAGKQMFEFYRMFGPKEFLPPDDNENFKFDDNFDKKVFGVDRSAIYVTNGRKWLDEKFYNPDRFLEELEASISKPDDGTATWRDDNFLYGTCIYAGMVKNKTRQEGVDRMIKFALYGFSYQRTYTLCLYEENHPEYFPPEKVEMNYVRTLKDYFEFLYKKLGYSPTYYKGDVSYSY
jgi:hypothetical protein